MKTILLITILLCSINVFGQDTLKTKYWDNGKKKSEMPFNNNLKEGTFKTWYESGIPESESEYRNNMPNGKSISWYENGKIKVKGERKNDKKFGDWTWYYESGNKKQDGYSGEADPLFR